MALGERSQISNLETGLSLQPRAPSLSLGLRLPVGGMGGLDWAPGRAKRGSAREGAQKPAVSHHVVENHDWVFEMREGAAVWR